MINMDIIGNRIEMTFFILYSMGNVQNHNLIFMVNYDKIKIEKNEENDYVST